MERAQICVVSFVTLSESIPPIAIVAPIIASLSIEGMSAHESTTSEKIIRGSGVKGRIWACFPLAKDAEIHLDLTTGIISAVASVYSSKSIEFAMMWVISPS